MNDVLTVSIIMPAFNSAPFIQQSILSVINQTYTHWELYIIDDYSTDKTEAISKTWAIKDKRIHYYRNSRNKGCSESRIYGISLSQTQWIAFLDSDDLWEKDKLEKQISLIKQDSMVGLVFTGSTFINETGKRSRYCLSVPRTITYKELLMQNIISCSSVLVKKELLQRYKMPSGLIHEDYAMWLQMLKDGVIARSVNQPLLIYRLSGNSKSGNKKKAFIMNYRVLKFMDLTNWQIGYYLLQYTIRNCRKYGLIHRGFRHG